VTASRNIASTASKRRDVKQTLARIEPLMIRIDERLNATLPHLATKAELADVKSELTAALADKPGKVFLAASIAVLITAYALGLAGIALPMLRGLVP
jgi:hypothetical protein